MFLPPKISPKKIFKVGKVGIILIGFILLGIGAKSHFIARADDSVPSCNDTSDACINSLKEAADRLNNNLQLSINATKPLEGQVESMKVQLTNIQAQINSITATIAQKEEDLKLREDKLATQQVLLNTRIRAYYIRSFLTSPLLVIFSPSNSSDLFQELTYSQATTKEDQQVISSVTNEMLNILQEKDQLEKDKTSLASVQAQVDKNMAFLNTQIDQAKAYQSDLSNQIADLNAKQQALIAQRSGNFSVSVGSAALADDYNGSLAGWQSNAPSGSVTVFSFGAYANNGGNYKRNGLSQYGAWARAKSGEDYNAILQAYYGQTAVSKSMPGTINTTAGSMPFETQYLYGIAEMPSSWTDNGGAALKAQAIAARTYAYHYTQSGQAICTDDHCQVYDSSKAANPPQAWKDAVDSTKGLVLPDGVSAQYVSTPGGYLDTKGWDTSCGSEGCLASNAWDSASPWFYKAWYTNFAYGSGFSTCSRTNPWLSQSDIADILNAWVVYNSGSSDDKNHILPPDNCGGGDPYSQDQMKSKADSMGGSYSNVSSVNVSQSTSGYTSSITFQTNLGSVTIPGFDNGCSHPGGGCKDFWTIFALRAPGNISIKSRLFDIRVK